jgi:hypothetical protein
VSHSNVTWPVKMEYGWNLWLKVSIIICRYATRTFLVIPQCADHVIFITAFVLLIKIPPFYEVNSLNRKWQAHGGISKIFTIIFKPEVLKFHPYSILTGQPMVVFVIYCVFRSKHRDSVQGVKSLGGHFVGLCWEFDFCEVKKKILLFFKKKREILLHF